MARKMSTALAPLYVSQTVPKRRGRGRPHAVWVEAPIADIAETEKDVVDVLNENLPTLYPTRLRRRQQPIPPTVVLDPPEHGPPGHTPYNIDDML